MLAQQVLHLPEKPSQLCGNSSNSMPATHGTPCALALPSGPPASRPPVCGGHFCRANSGSASYSSPAANVRPFALANLVDLPAQPAASGGGGGGDGT